MVTGLYFGYGFGAFGYGLVTGSWIWLRFGYATFLVTIWLRLDEFGYEGCGIWFAVDLVETLLIMSLVKNCFRFGYGLGQIWLRSWLMTASSIWLRFGDACIRGTLVRVCLSVGCGG